MTGSTVAPDEGVTNQQFVENDENVADGALRLRSWNVFDGPMRPLCGGPAAEILFSADLEP
jgi:hypothetical protein